MSKSYAKLLITQVKIICSFLRIINKLSILNKFDPNLFVGMSASKNKFHLLAYKLQVKLRIIPNINSLLFWQNIRRIWSPWPWVTFWLQTFLGLSLPWWLSRHFLVGSSISNLKTRLFCMTRCMRMMTNYILYNLIMKIAQKRSHKSVKIFIFHIRHSNLAFRFLRPATPFTYIDGI